MAPIKAVYTWTETEQQIRLSVPLKGVSPKKVDIFVSGRFLKLNFSPYLLDIVLFDVVDSVKHKATVKDGILVVTLQKVTPGIWGECEVEADKEALKSVKEEAISARAHLEENLAKQRADQRIADEKTTLRKQMAIDEEKRRQLESLQADEKQEAEREVYEAFAKMTASKPSTSAPATASTPSTGAAAPTSLPSRSVPDDSLFDEDDIEDEDQQETAYRAQALPAITASDRRVADNGGNVSVGREVVNGETDEDIRYVPPPRAPAEGKVSIHFTPRVFPTPMRESKLLEEEEWIAKNRQHLRHHGVLGKGARRSGAADRDVTEEDPVWLKAQGDDFFRTGNMQSAINAYSAALETDPNMWACYANRSACYLKLGWFPQCKADCDQLIAHDQHLPLPSSAHETPEQKELVKSWIRLIKTHCRRGAAMCQLGQFNEALADYCHALGRWQQIPVGAQAVHAPLSAEALQADINRVKLLCEVDQIKKEGDGFFAQQSLHEALDRYTQAIDKFPVHIPSLSNRSAVRLALGDLPGAIQDCQTAIDLLQSVAPSTSLPTHSGHGMLAAILPPPGSDKRKQWLLKTLLRQGVAWMQCQQYAQAVCAYEQAVALEPGDDKLKADLQSMQALAQQAEKDRGGGEAQHDAGGE